MMIACLDRHLREHGATYSILKERQLNLGNMELKGKQKMKADVITEKEEELVGEQGALGC